jgi:hypothetical protein
MTFGYLGHHLAGGRIDQVGHRQAQRVHHVENAPDADPQAVVAPAVVPGVRRRSEGCRRMTETFAEAEVLDVEGDVKGKFLSARPFERLSPIDRRIVVAIMLFETHRGLLLCRGF